MSRLSGLVMILFVLGLPTERQHFARADEKAKTEQKVYVPKDLDDCLAQLKKILKPEDIEKMKRGTEKDMTNYHFGLGMWMRNNWNLWKGGRLATWFNKKGIYHPDDMSGIILDSFWRHLNSKPIELDKQIKQYQEFWKRAKANKKRENERAKRAVEQIRKMMMGISLGTTPASVVRIPDRNPDQTADGLRARYLVRLGSNVLIAIRTGPVENFTTPGYYLDLEEKKIHPIKVPEIEEQQYAVVCGGVTYFSGLAKGAPVLIAIQEDRRKSITLPVEKLVPQLGVDGEKLLAVYGNSIYTLRGTAWSELYKGEIRLPKSGPPPRKFGDKIFFHDGGRHEDEKRLWWLELTKAPLLTSIDEDVGVVVRKGPRWENSYSYCVTPEGDLWAMVGSRCSGQSLVKRSANGKYEVAVINNSVQFNGELLCSASDDSGLSLSAVSMGANGTVLLAGDKGIYTLKGKKLQQVVAFENVNTDLAINYQKWHGCPGDILPLDNNRCIISGVFGGIYLIERTAANKYSATGLDETISKPVPF